MIGALGLVPGMPHLPFLWSARCSPASAATIRRGARGRRDAPRRGVEGRPGPARAAEPGVGAQRAAARRPRARDRLRPDPARRRERGRRAAQARLARPPPDGRRARARARADPDPRQRPARLAQLRRSASRAPRSRAASSCPAACSRWIRATPTRPSTASPRSSPRSACPRSGSPPSARERAEASGYTVVDPASVIITHLTETIRQHADELLSRQDAKLLLDGLKERHPVPVEELVPDLLSVGEVHRVLLHAARRGDLDPRPRHGRRDARRPRAPDQGPRAARRVLPAGARPPDHGRADRPERRHHRDHARPDRRGRGRRVDRADARRQLPRPRSRPRASRSSRRCAPRSSGSPAWASGPSSSAPPACAATCAR